MSHICRTHRCQWWHYNIAGVWLSNNFSGLYVTPSGTSAGSTHLYTDEQCRYRPHDIYPGGRIVLLIYIQCGAGSGTVACRHFQGIFTASVFLSVSASQDRMCICNTAHTQHAKCSRQGSPPRHPASASRARNKLRVRSSLVPGFSQLCSWQKKGLWGKVQRSFFEYLPGFHIRRRRNFRASHGRERSLTQGRIAFLGRCVHHHSVPQNGNPDCAFLAPVGLNIRKLFSYCLVYLICITVGISKFCLAHFRRSRRFWAFGVVAAGAGGQH